MSKYLVLYSFHKIHPAYLEPLFRLRQLNPNTMIVPLFGVQQHLPIPSHLALPLVSQFAYRFNTIALQSAHFLKLSETVSMKVESFRRRHEINSLDALLREHGFELYLDFTPMGLWNLDLVILRWFEKYGSHMDFEYLIFHECDVNMTRPVAEIYGKYSAYDIAMAEYREATPHWRLYDSIFGGRKRLVRWLRKHRLHERLFAGLFAGSIISKRALARLEGVELPYSFCEMRLPTILNALGLKCGRLDFPLVRCRPTLSETEIRKASKYGIFHPVKYSLPQQALRSIEYS